VPGGCRQHPVIQTRPSRAPDVPRAGQSAAWHAAAWQGGMRVSMAAWQSHAAAGSEQARTWYGFAPPKGAFQVISSHSTVPKAHTSAHRAATAQSAEPALVPPRFALFCCGSPQAGTERAQKRNAGAATRLLVLGQQKQGCARWASPAGKPPAPPSSTSGASHLGFWMHSELMKSVVSRARLRLKSATWQARVGRGGGCWKVGGLG
jgi:hypothetical protein